MTSIGRHHTQATRNEVEERARATQVNDKGEIVSPNGTGVVLNVKENGHIEGDDAHINDMEFKYQKEFSEKNNFSQEKHDSIFEKACFYQKEPHNENISHKYEEKDHNEGMQNVTMAAFGEDHSIGKNIFINQSADGKSGTIDYENPETGEVNNLSTYTLSSESPTVSQNNAVSNENINSVPTAATEPDSPNDTASWFQDSEDDNNNDNVLTNDDCDGCYNFDDEETL